jgi:L-arabinose isomerase
MLAKAGLLPLFMDKIDITSPQARTEFEKFIKIISAKLEKLGLEIIPAKITCKRKEVIESIKLFEKQKTDAVITLHLTYSPSLESAGVISETNIPVIVLDTTQSYEFGPDRNLSDVLYNHGIHGVQDFCNLLKRNKKSFFVETGHWKFSDVLERVARRTLQSKMALGFLNINVGLLNKPLEGMGDFQVESDVLKRKFNFNIIKSDAERIKDNFGKISEEELSHEIKADQKKFIFSDIDNNLYKNSLRASLCLRKWIEENNLNAFSMNVFEFAKGNNAYIPFLEASKELAAGRGYAGEGDILTASLTYSIMNIYNETTFTEMFCPDWKNNTIFLSHIGEGNFNLLNEKPLIISKKYPLAEFKDVLVAVGRLKSGRANIINIAPISDNEFEIIVIRGTMQDINRKDNLNTTIHGWFKPDTDIISMLAKYSEIGGTHHVVLTYNDIPDDIMGFGKILGCPVNVI